MSTDSKPDQPETPEDPLKSFILLALPWLSFQRHILDIAKKNIQDAANIKPTERFAFSELHALMMILDPSRKIRGDDEPVFEKKVKEAYDEIVPKLTSASVQLLEAQDRALESAFEVLNSLRQGDKAKHRPKSQD
jgi:hypothetical protein